MFRANSYYILIIITCISVTGTSQACTSIDMTKQDIELIILSASLRHGIDADLVWAKAKVESNFDPCIVSSAGAMGIMQLMPNTAADLSVNDPFDAYENIDAGVRYLKQMFDKFEIPQLALAAYNAGPGAIMNKRRVPNYIETKKHIRKVIKIYQKRTGILTELAAINALTY